MFDNKQIEQFRQIKAPDELRSKVLGAKRLPVRTTVLRYGALAACFVIMMTAVLLFRGRADGIAVTMNGCEVTTEGVYAVPGIVDTAAYSIQRTSPVSSGEALEIPLEFAVTGECRLRVSSGSLLLDGEEMREDASLDAGGSLNLIWRIESADREAYYSLVLQSENEQTILVMKYDNGWMIRLNEN